jgi:hypothetical protein
MPMKWVTSLLASVLMAATWASACSQAEERGETVPAADIESAFLFAFPIYEFARTAQTNVGEEQGVAPSFNQISQRSTLSDHTARSVTAPNNDTIYISAFLDLASGPVTLEAPSSRERYFSIAFMSAMTDNFAYIGTRATGGGGGVFQVAGPGWQGEASDGVTVIQAPTNDVWMLMRTLVDGPEDLEAAQAFQAQLTLSPPEGYVPARFESAAADVMDPVNFLTVVNEMLRRSPGGTGPIARASGFTDWGIGADPDTLSEDMIEAWRDYLPQGVQMLRNGFRNRRDVRNGWSYQPPGVGDFGDNDRLRSAVALGGLAALGEEEAMYFHANFGPDGEVLNGTKTYRWRLPAGGVPVDAFWSVTLYEASPDGRWFLVDNPIRRYSIGNRTPGLVYEEDGSLEIYIQADPPGEDRIANWLPAPRDTDMRLALRAYLPREDVRAREWMVPPLEIVE